MQLARVQPQLAALGVTTVAVLNSLRERAQLYFKYQPIGILLAADPDLVSHRAFGMQTLHSLHGLTHEHALALRIDPTGELGGSKPAAEARDELNRRDGYVTTPQEDQLRARPQGLAMLFLIDRIGVIQWRWIEAMRRPEDVGTFPDATELLSAARTLEAGAPAAAT